MAADPVPVYAPGIPAPPLPRAEVRIIAPSGHVFVLTHQQAWRSAMMRNLIYDCGLEHNAELPILFNEPADDVHALVFRYLARHANDPYEHPPADEVRFANTDAVSAADQELLNEVPAGTDPFLYLFRVVNLANYYGVDELVTAAMSMIGNHTRGMTIDQLYHRLGLINGFTEEEFRLAAENNPEYAALIEEARRWQREFGPAHGFNALNQGGAAPMAIGGPAGV